MAVIWPVAIVAANVAGSSEFDAMRLRSEGGTIVSINHATI